MIGDIVCTRPIPGHDGYFADAWGHVWSSHRGRWGSTYSQFHRRKTHPDPDGYPTVRLLVPSAGKYKSYHVHVLIAAAFLGPRPDGHHVCHYNGVKTDNSVTNLMYGTPSENIQQAVQHGTHVRGVRCHSAKLTDESAAEVRRRRAAGEPLAVLAKEFGMSVAAICAAGTGRTWRHLTAVSA